MKFIVEKEVLALELNAVLGSVERKKVVPILANVKLDCKGNKLYITATDMDLFATSVGEVKGEEDGITTVPAHLLYDIVKKTPDGAEIKFTYDGEKQTMDVHHGSSKFKLPCLDPDSFPVINEGGVVSNTKISSKILSALIERVRFAISNDETRYYLNGIYLHTMDNTLKSVATDGYKLAMFGTEKPENFDFAEGAILPKKTIAEVKRIIDADPSISEVEVMFSQNKVKFIFNNTILISKLVDGKFPDYERVIPTGNDKEIKLAKKDLVSIVDRISIIVNEEKSKLIKLTFSQHNLNIQAQTSEGSSGNEDLAVDYDFPEEIIIGFNPAFLLEALSQIEGDDVILDIKNSSSPVMVKDPKNATLLYILMPMRV